MNYYVYILTNRPRGSLYVGVTNDLVRRVYEHKNGFVEGFTKTYNLKQVVFYECYEDVNFAIRREKNLKTWLRDWKIQLVEKSNPEWQDLWSEIVR